MLSVVCAHWEPQTNLFLNLNDRDDVDIERCVKSNYEPHKDSRDVAEFEASFSENFPKEAAAAAVPWEQQVDENPDEYNYGDSDDDRWEREDSEDEGMWEEYDDLVETLDPEDGEDEEDDFSANGMAQY